MAKIKEADFREIFEQELGNDWERAFAVFQNYGENLAFDVTNVLLYAVDQNKVNEVLSILEEHYRDHLAYQHPDIRGTVINKLLGINPTEAMFLRICQQVLYLV